MTIVEAIKKVLENKTQGLTSKQIYEEIIHRNLYSFGAENPVGVVNAQLRRRCNGLDFPTAYPVKFFEIAGYEGKNSIVLIEAKNSNATDTIIRQLYFPFRQWQLYTTKKVYPLFFERKFVDNEIIFYIWQYEFTNINDYNSIRLVKSARYRIIE